MKLLDALFGKRTTASTTLLAQTAPPEVVAATSSPFDLVAHFWDHEGLPILDWEAAQAWVGSITDESERVSARTQCQRGWLLHFRDALGEGYALHESQQCLLLAPYVGRPAQATLAFVAQTRARVLSALDGVARRGHGEKEILIVFANPETYYTYVSHAYPEGAESAFSSGMFLHAHCPHFVTMHEEMHTVERVIAHEMTHASLAHLRIPLWLNEGIAVNTEDRLMGRLPQLYTPAEMREKHTAFWNETTIQEFWSGSSFHRPDDGNMLSYDLARILVEILSAHWEPFRAFANRADYEDGGHAAARDQLCVDLGVSTAALFDATDEDRWRPDASRWQGEIEHVPE